MAGGYENLSTAQLMTLLKEKDRLLASSGGPGRLTGKAAQEMFLKQKPTNEMKLSKFPATVEKMREEFSQRDNAGIGKATHEDVCSVLKHCKLSEAEAKEMADGFFVIGDLKKTGKILYPEFLAELVRMQTFKVMRVLQYRINEKDAAKKEWDPVNKIEVSFFRELLTETGMGATAVEEQVKDCCSQQIGKNVTTMTLKGLVKWYFGKYYPESDTVLQEIEVKEPDNSKKIAAYKKTIDAAVKEIEGALKKPESKDKTQEVFMELSFYAGKLFGVMEFLDSDLEKVCSAKEQEHISHMIEKCVNLGVKFG